MEQIKEIADKILRIDEERKKEAEKNGKVLKTISDGLEFLRKQQEDTEKKYSDDPLVNEKLEKLTKKQNELEDQLKSVALKTEANTKYNTVDGLAKTLDDGYDKATEKEIPTDYRRVAKSILHDPHKEELNKAFLKMIKDPLSVHHQQKFHETGQKIIASDTDPEDSYIKKSLTSITGQQAGYLTPPEFDLMINRVLFETSPIRSVATTQMTTRRAYHFPIRTSLPTATWGDSELGEPADTQEQSYVLGEIPIHELNAKPSISLNQLEDSAINIERELRTDLAEAFMLAENTAFIKGEGPKQPSGLETYAKRSTKDAKAVNNPLRIESKELSVASYKANDNSYLLSNALLDLEGALFSPYKRRAYYLVSRGVKNLIRQVRDKNNQYLFSNFSGWGGVQGVPSIRDGINGRICGYPVLECDDLPSNLDTANTYPIYFGNFEKYKIIERIGLTLILDNVTRKGFMIYYFRKRLGAGFCLTQGVKVLKLIA